MSKDLPASIADTQKLLFSQHLSAVQLVDMYLQNIKKHEHLNAFITVTQDLAYSQAKATDKSISELGESILSQKPLLGTVIAHKDLFSTKGVRTTAGSKVLESYVPEYSATVVKRLEEAGAICIGKTNLDSWGHGSSGENSDFGPTKNPWNPRFVPGGSSSGSAVSVAAQMSLISTGTDTGGSVRLPASFCGVYGLKPTYGAVSRYGVIAMASSLDTVGHFASTIEDIKKVFLVTAGKDYLDANIQNKVQESPKEITIGLPKQYFGSGINSEVSSKIESAIKSLKNLGIKFKDMSLPNTKYATAVYYIIMPAEVSSNLSRYDGIRYGKDRDAFSDEAKRRIMLGSYVLSAGYYDAYYLKAMKVRSLIKSDFDKAFGAVDAILTPVSPTPPFKLGQKTSDPLQMYLSDILTAGPSLAGIPGLSVPCGFDHGLPIGFQILAKQFNENTLFTIASMFEKATDGEYTKSKS